MGTLRTDSLLLPGARPAGAWLEGMTGLSPINPQEVEFSPFLLGMSRDVVRGNRAEGLRYGGWCLWEHTAHSGQHWACLVPPCPPVVPCTCLEFHLGAASLLWDGYCPFSVSLLKYTLGGESVGQIPPEPDFSPVFPWFAPQDSLCLQSLLRAPPTAVLVAPAHPMGAPRARASIRPRSCSPRAPPGPCTHPLCAFEPAGVSVVPQCVCARACVLSCA